MSTVVSTQLTDSKNYKTSVCISFLLNFSARTESAFHRSAQILLNNDGEWSLHKFILGASNVTSVMYYKRDNSHVTIYVLYENILYEKSKDWLENHPKRTEVSTWIWL